MTLLDGARTTPERDEAQLLFQEARERRRRRWLISGIALGVVAAVLAVTLGMTLGRSARSIPGPAPASPLTPAITHATVSLNFRPVLCEAPPLTLESGRSASTGSLPSCSPASQLTASNLSVNTSDGMATVRPPPDPQFSGIASTPAGSAAAAGTVLLPGAQSQGGARFVLGPAGLTEAGIASAKAVDENGQWMVTIKLTPQGSVQWDALAQQQFHAMVGVVENGTVISVPLTQPAQASFASFSGELQIAAGFTESQAKALAASI